MKKAKKKRDYDSSGRREEAERTRARILEAASELLRTVRPENLSYADIAERSEVAVRTVYRHFPEPVDLLRAVAKATVERFAPGGLKGDRAGVADQLASFHRVMSAEPTLFRVFMAAPVRSELAYPGYIRALFADAVDGQGLTPDQATALCALLELLMSPFAWEVLHTHWQLPPERITRACLAAAQFLADGVRRHADWLEPNEPPPPLFRAPRAPSSKGKASS
ncbi:MAG TPA: TetR/AcrR family transcriptional regulator [Polyangiaceae bacterium]|nr:TetR/AcrR family transcriptional regulator [Polyangiaceae bacterium]